MKPIKRNLGWNTFGRTEEGIEKDYQALIKRLAKEEEERAKANQQNNSNNQNNPVPATNPSLAINKTTDFWEVDGVEYRNGIYKVRLAKALLENGTAKTQDNWAEYAIKAKEKNEFYTPDMPLSHSLFTALSKLKTDEAEEAREFIKTQMRAKYPITLTRIAYNPSGKDKVIHNYGIPNEKYEFDSDFVGENGFIAGISPAQYLEDLIGTNNVTEINKVYQSINGTDARIWRVNSKPNNADERVAGFSAYSDGVDLYCDRGPQGADASFGVFASLRSRRS